MTTANNSKHKVANRTTTVFLQIVLLFGLIDEASDVSKKNFQ